MKPETIFLISVVLIVVVIIGFVFIGLHVAANEAENITPESTLPVTTASTTEETEATETECTVTETAATMPSVALYDVPLSDDLQFHIIKQAESHGIDPAVVMAMIWKESTYYCKAVGDGGNSIGLMQIQPKWHGARMEKLGCTDLFNPYQNVVVGVDYLSECLNRYGSIEAALTAYNAGSYTGTVTQYANTVLAMAAEIRGECQ